MNAVSVHNLIKRYKNGKATIEAVKGVSFDVAPGELFGIIGPDGAGKTSLFRMLTTLLLPDAGHAQVDGCDVTRRALDTLISQCYCCRAHMHLLSVSTLRSFTLIEFRFVRRHG